jgi:oligoribonuclease
MNDVSSIKELTRRWFPKAYFNAPAKTGNHRALGDIQDSIAELAYYRQAVFNSAADSDENTSVKQGPTTP